MLQKGKTRPPSALGVPNSTATVTKVESTKERKYQIAVTTRKSACFRKHLGILNEWDIRTTSGIQIHFEEDWNMMHNFDRFQVEIEQGCVL